MKRVYLLIPTDNQVQTDSLLALSLETAKTYGASTSFLPFSTEALPKITEELSKGNGAVVMENIALDFSNKTKDSSIVIVKGLSLENSPLVSRKLNEMLALALDASVLLVASNELSLETECLEKELQENRVRVIAKTTENEFSQKLEENLKAPAKERKISQAEFRASLLVRAGANLKRIVLPEGTEPRTIEAAILAYERKIAIPVLLGNRKEIENVAESKNLKIPEGLEIIEVNEESGKKYIPTLVELRKAKGMTEELATSLLKDSVWLGTMMLKMGEVDGLVSGAVHSTADTVRPALQIIKTAKGVKSISSVFFMCLPSETLVYGDCAITPNPDAETLATIAAQSNDTAKAFGLPARVAMLSYSTGKSGKGDDVDLVLAALEILKKERPDILVDGPLQYDAASTESVAEKKMPGSPVAGKASVFVFPDLNSGNISYKAVQRSAPNVISVGPMLQGLAKPVNDLSRGALVEDIVYTIALTAIQAQAE